MIKSKDFLQGGSTGSFLTDSYICEFQAFTDIWSVGVPYPDLLFLESAKLEFHCIIDFSGAIKVSYQSYDQRFVWYDWTQVMFWC